jgi:hypothetical protein
MTGAVVIHKTFRVPLQKFSLSVGSNTRKIGVINLENMISRKDPITNSEQRRSIQSESLSPELRGYLFSSNLTQSDAQSPERELTNSA